MIKDLFAVDEGNTLEVKETHRLLTNNVHNSMGSSVRKWTRKLRKKEFTSL